MKPKPCFDPDFDANPRRRSRPARSVGPLAIVVIFFGLTLAAMAGRAARQAPGAPAYLIVAHDPTAIQQPGQDYFGTALQARDREPFVIMAPAGIDPEMVTPAPAGIDPAMVVHPGNAIMPQAPTAPQLAPVVPFPGLNPSRVPHRPAPPHRVPRSRTPAKPR
jgi:hypothetical protein